MHYFAASLVILVLPPYATIIVLNAVCGRNRLEMTFINYVHCTSRRVSIDKI